MIKTALVSTTLLSATAIIISSVGVAVADSGWSSVGLRAGSKYGAMPRSGHPGSGAYQGAGDIDDGGRGGFPGRIKRDGQHDGIINGGRSGHPGSGVRLPSLGLRN